MRAFVTGCAGFIGSHLAEALLDQGWSVIGIDGFTDYYARPLKVRNLTSLSGRLGFTFYEADLLTADLPQLMNGVTHVFHLAGEPGVRSAWGPRFSVYTERNLLTTQMLLEAASQLTLERFLFASTSSVYGLAEAFPTPESAEPKPVSPYGVTKLASEQMVRVYRTNFAIPGVILRFFTAYGPRQRPDMAFTKFYRSLLNDEEITIFGDGSQTRDFTYVADIADGILRAATRAPAGSTINLGSGTSTSLGSVLTMMEEIAGRRFRMRYTQPQKGEMAHTAADITLARSMLGYTPQTSLRHGLQRQYDWIRSEAVIGR